MRSTTTRSQNDVHRECKIIIYPLPWSCVSSPPYFSLILRNIPVLAFYLLRPLMIKLSVESSSMSATTSHMHFSSIVERFFYQLLRHHDLDNFDIPGSLHSTVFDFDEVLRFFIPFVFHSFTPVFSIKL
jgi:hypothetical protein